MDRDDCTSSSSKKIRPDHTGHRAVTGEEQELWRRATRDVPRLKSDGGKLPAEALPKPAEPSPVATARATRPAAVPAPAAAPAGLDQRTRKRLQRGQIPPEARIDLHSCTQDEAFRQLQHFLAAAQSAGRRCVLVITGKGYGAGGTIGVLKAGVPRWLGEEPNRSRVLAHCPATPSFGGEGALFVLLRRARNR